MRALQILTALFASVIASDNRPAIQKLRHRKPLPKGSIGTPKPQQEFKRWKGGRKKARK